MKVNTDIQSRLHPQQMGVQSTRQGQPGAQAVQQSVTRQNQVQSDPSLRGIANAMSIMHKAQLIVQRALNVSLRLQSIAQNSFSSSPDVNQLGKEIQTINTSLGEFGATVSSPPVDHSVDMEPVRQNVQQMGAMITAGRGDSSDISAITSSLQERSDTIGRAIVSIEREYNIQSSPSSKAAAAKIRGNQEQALAAHYPIQPELVKNI